MQNMQEQVNTTDKIKSGINKASKIVVSTMGGHGKNVLMFKDGNLTFTKDGVSVASNLVMKDPQEDIGCQLVINAAKQTVKDCGDGTTLTCLLVSKFLEQMYNESLNPDFDFNAFISNAEHLVEDVKQEIKNKALPIESSNDVYNIALTSCKDPKLAELIQHIFIKVGIDSNVSVELGRYNNKTFVEYTKGMMFDSGYINSYFANQDNGDCVFESPYIIISNEPINVFQDIDSMVGQAHSINKPIVFIAPNFSESVVKYAVTNKERGIKICLIKTPGWAEAITHNIKDITAFLNTDNTVNKIVITPYQFTLFNNPVAKTINKRVKQLQSLLKSSSEEWEAKELQRRIADIQQKSVIIYVGGVTEKSAKEEFDRIEDAIGAIKSAAKMGFVPGVGSMLYELADQKDYPLWLKEVLKAPNKQIMDNARFNVYGQQINTKTFEIDTNLIDPVYVICSAISNAFALTKLIITTEYVIFS